MEIAGKTRTGLQKWMVKQYVRTFVLAAITTYLFTKIFAYYGLTDAGMMKVQLFMFVHIVVFGVKLSYSGIISSRCNYLHGKWVIKETLVTDESIVNPWQRIGLFGLSIAIGIALSICSIIHFLGVQFGSALNIGIIVLLGTYISSVLINRHSLYKDLQIFANTINNREQNHPLPFWRYFSGEIVAGMLITQWVINSGLGLIIYYPETVRTGGVVYANTVIHDICIATTIVCIFVWIFTERQVRGDVHLGLVEKKEKNGLVTPVRITIIFGVHSAIIALTAYGLFNILKIDQISILSALIIKAVFIGCTTIVGCWLGVWWGGHKESELIRNGLRRF